MMIEVQSGKKLKAVHNFWNNVLFHPTDAIEDDWGRKILDEIAKDGAAKIVRIYNMFEDIVTMDEKGNLRYDYTLNDQRIAYLLEKGFTPMIAYACIPAWLARDPDLSTSVSKNKTRYKGKMFITSPPKDYALWEEICYQYTRHIVEKFGRETVRGWYLHCFNEPDIPSFFMSDLDKSDESVLTRAEEYLNLYRAFVRAAERVDPKLRIGGPALANKLVFMEAFLKAVHGEGLKLDYVCFHTYGTNPDGLNSGNKPFDVKNTLVKHQAVMEIVERWLPETVEVVVDEWGMASHGFFNMEECPAFILRETSGYAAYFGKMIERYVRENVRVDQMLICLSGQHEMVTDFSGFRNFFTLHFIKKPIYNAFILMRDVGGDLLASDTDVEGLAVLPVASSDGVLRVVLAYASEQFDRRLPEVDDVLRVAGVSDGNYEVTVRVIDETRTNPYALACRNGYAAELTDAQIALLREEGNLKAATQTLAAQNGVLSVPLRFSDNALVLVEIK